VKLRLSVRRSNTEKGIAGLGPHTAGVQSWLCLAQNAALVVHAQAEPAAFDWAPKEFTEEGDDTDEKGASDPAAAGAAAAAGGGDMTGAAEQQEDAVPASSSAAQGEGSSEYVYDPATG
jgi:hypothetical protein